MLLLRLLNWSIERRRRGRRRRMFFSPFLFFFFFCVRVNDTQYLKWIIDWSRVEVYSSLTVAYFLIESRVFYHQQVEAWSPREKEKVAFLSCIVASLLLATAFCLLICNAVQHTEKLAALRWTPPSLEDSSVLYFRGILSFPYCSWMDDGYFWITSSLARHTERERGDSSSTLPLLLRNRKLILYFFRLFLLVVCCYDEIIQSRQFPRIVMKHTRLFWCTTWWLHAGRNQRELVFFFFVRLISWSIWWANRIK